MCVGVCVDVCVLQSAMRRYLARRTCAKMRMTSFIDTVDLAIVTIQVSPALNVASAFLKPSSGGVAPVFGEALVSEWGVTECHS